MCESASFSAGKILVTGGAGFIGSAVVRFLINETQHDVINVDKLTYAGNLDSIATISDNPRYQFERVDICDQREVERVFRDHGPTTIMHLAAESHVDRSISGPANFIQTNICGTFNLLDTALDYWRCQSESFKSNFRFHHVSTDEVYGDLHLDADPFDELSPYLPSSPYAASKASSDHLVRAWHRTYGLPIVISNCSNNYGPYQFPEKLIPLVILNAKNGKPLPIYGTGAQIRDWLYVEDHARALYQVATAGVVGQTYNIGGGNEMKNIDVVYGICELLEEMVRTKPKNVTRFRDLISHVVDRPGHDYRYAINASKIERYLNWSPSETFESGLRKTVSWYLQNAAWCKRAQEESFQGDPLAVNREQPL